MKNSFPLQLPIIKLLLLVVLLYRTAVPDIYSGKVKDSESGAPVSGVLVSPGHGLYRTTTDADGIFSLDIPANGIRRSHHPRLSTESTIIWDGVTRTIYLTQSPQTESVSLFRLDGRRLFYHTFTGNRRITTIPEMTPGMYVMTLHQQNGTVFSRKIPYTTTPSIYRFPLPAIYVSPAHSASADPGRMFIFRHDDYYPLDQNVPEPSENLNITFDLDPRRFVFDQTNIHSYYFTLTQDDSLSMERNALAEEYTPAEFTFNATAYGKVGIRYKGSDYYSMPRCFDEEGNRSDYPECANVSLKVKFNKFVDETRFYAMKRLNLHSMSADDSKLREMLAYGIYRDAGIYTCRTAFAKVYINGVFRGLFTAVENVDGRFTKSRWPAYGDGNLYKEAWPFRSVKGYYRDALKTNDNPEDSASVNGMYDFYKAIQNATPETFVAHISPFMDTDYFLRYIVVDRAIHNSDGIMTWYTDDNWTGNHNYFFYEEENSGGKFWLIPWDLNATLYESEPMVDQYDMPEWNEVQESCDPITVWGDGLAIPPNCDKLTGLTAATLWDRFVEQGEQFLSTVFDTTRLQKTADRFTALIESSIEEDPLVASDDWKDEAADLRSAFGTLYRGFDDYIHGRVPELDTAGYSTPFPDDSGFSINLLNNFEFGTATSIDSWSWADISENSSISLALDTVSPLWGRMDALCSFVFYPLDTTRTYSEWSSAGFLFNDEFDFSFIDKIRIDLQCDHPRYCTVYLESDVYERHDIDVRYGWFHSLSVKNKQYSFDMSTIAYPEWADPDTPDLLDSVITTVKGIGFNINARFDSNGQMEVVPDSGFLHIDNILFEFISK